MVPALPCTPISLASFKRSALPIPHPHPAPLSRGPAIDPCQFKSTALRHRTRTRPSANFAAIFDCVLQTLCQPFSPHPYPIPLTWGSASQSRLLWPSPSQMPTRAHPGPEAAQLQANVSCIAVSPMGSGMKGHIDMGLLIKYLQWPSPAQRQAAIRPARNQAIAISCAFGIKRWRAAQACPAASMIWGSQGRAECQDWERAC